MGVKLYEATWQHGKSRNGMVTYINAPDEEDEQCLVAIVSSTFNEETREYIAKRICESLKDN